jgi:2-keto-4-pentenoate hydratase/2-oxohepta-3-ene-1,7-dioic acid hydratase in catechol pathway
MRIASVLYDGAPALARLDEHDVTILDTDDDLRTLLAAGRDPAALGARGTLGGTGEPSFLAPLAPGKVVAIGLNYADHVRESGMAAPERPLVFAKFPSSVIGAGEAIELDPAIAERVDWEVELAVVIGRRMRRVAAADALDHVFGYTIGNDISARDVQFADGQWVRGKSLDTSCPLGPVVVTRDEIPDPQALRLALRVNGETMQDSTTAEMVFGVAELLAFCSASFTLEPGDVLLTGTPWGCGEFMDPVRSLQAGDLVEAEVEGIGVLRNPVQTAQVA